MNVITKYQMYNQIQHYIKVSSYKAYEMLIGIMQTVYAQP